MVAGEILEISLHEAGIGTIPLPAGPTSFLFTGNLRIRLDIATLAGTFRTSETEVTTTGNSATEHFEGTATVVTCPPGG